MDNEISIQTSREKRIRKEWNQKIELSHRKSAKILVDSEQQLDQDGWTEMGLQN